MTADKCPGDLNVLGSDEVSELFGWPVSLLDEIRELSDLAEQGEIWIDEWRRRDALLRASGPGQSPREQLERIDDILSSKQQRGLKAQFQERRERVARWLLSSAQIDDVTGLPWDYLGRYRRLSDPLLGAVPAYAGVARRRALAEAPDEVARLARQLRPEGMQFPAVDELDQLALTRFPSLVIEAAAKGDTDAADIQPGAATVASA